MHPNKSEKDVESDCISDSTDSSSFGEVSQMRTSLPNLAMEVDRYGISDRAAAAIATAVLVDLGLVTEDDHSKVIDKNKIKRERRKARKNFQSNATQNRKDFHAFYFDSRKDDTVKKKKEGDKWYTHTEKEEHFVLVSEPGCEYLAHVAPASSKSKPVADCLIGRLSDMGLLSGIEVVGFRQYKC